MNIRKAIKDDIPDIISLTKDLAEIEHFEGYATPSTYYEKHLFGDNPQTECFLMEDQGDVIGMAMIFENLATYTGGIAVNLQDFIIHKDHRGKGYGKVFLQFLVNLAKERNYHSINWATYEWNKTARSLYDQFAETQTDVLKFCISREAILEKAGE